MNDPLNDQFKFDSLSDDIQKLEVEVAQLTIKQKENQLDEKRRQLQSMKNAWQMEENRLMKTILNSMSTNSLFLKDLVVIIKNYCLIISLFVDIHSLFSPIFNDVISIKFNPDDNIFSLLVSFTNNGFDMKRLLYYSKIHIALIISLNTEYENSPHNKIYQQQFEYDGGKGFTDTTKKTLIEGRILDSIRFYSSDDNIVKYFRLLQ